MITVGSQQCLGGLTQSIAYYWIFIIKLLGVGTLPPVLTVLPRHGRDVQVAGLGGGVLTGPTGPSVHGVVVGVQLQSLVIIHLKAAQKMVEAFSLRQLIF